MQRLSQVLRCSGLTKLGHGVDYFSMGKVISLLIPLLLASACGAVTPTAPTILATESRILTLSRVISVRLVVAPSSPSVNEAVTFSAHSNSVGDATLDFGDGSRIGFSLVASTTTLKHIYSRQGTFQTTLTVKNPDGDSASSTAPVIVQ
jgi:PKD repeat protein